MNLGRISFAAKTKRSYSLNAPHAQQGDGSDGSGDGLVPLINVVFLLMVFFMLAGSISKRDDLAIDPPESITEYGRIPAARILQVMSDGSLHLDSSVIELEELSNLGLSQVEIHADAQTDVGRLKPVLAALQSSGLKEVRLLTRRP